MDMQHKFIMAIIGFFAVIGLFAMPANIMSHAPMHKSQGEQVYKGDSCSENEYKVSSKDIEKYGNMETAIKVKKIKPTHSSLCMPITIK